MAALPQLICFSCSCQFCAGRCSGLINDEDLHVGRGSVFRILFAVEGEVCADIAETSDPLPPFAKARMVKAHRFADNRDQASAVFQSS